MWSITFRRFQLISSSENGIILGGMRVPGSIGLQLSGIKYRRQNVEELMAIKIPNWKREDKDEFSLLDNFA